MKYKARKFSENLKTYKLTTLRPVFYKIIFSFSIILFVLLFQFLNIKPTNWVLAKMKYNIEYKVDFKLSGLKMYKSVKALVKDSKEKIQVFNMDSKEKYSSPINGEIYKTYEKETNKGIDIKSIDGEDPKSILDGTVKDIYLQDKQGYFVNIVKDDVELVYGYLSKVHISKGDILEVGTPIGILGTNKDGNQYLRIELKINGIDENPLDYIDLGQ